MKPKVRLATATDLPLLLRAPDLFDGVPSAEGLARHFDSPSAFLALALNGSSVLGFASAFLHVRPDQPAEMYIDDLGVLPRHRRNGIATALIDCLTQTAKASSCNAIWVLADKTAQALGFYQALGWEREGSHIAMFTRKLT